MHAQHSIEWEWWVGLLLLCFFGFLVWIPFNSHRSVHSFSCGFLSPPCMLLSFPWRLHSTRLFCEHLQHSFVYFVFVFLHRISSTYNRRMGVLRRRRCLFIFSPFSVEKNCIERTLKQVTEGTSLPTIHTK